MRSGASLRLSSLLLPPRPLHVEGEDHGGCPLHLAGEDHGGVVPLVPGGVAHMTQVLVSPSKTYPLTGLVGGRTGPRKVW